MTRSPSSPPRRQRRRFLRSLFFAAVGSASLAAATTETPAWPPHSLGPYWVNWVSIDPAGTTILTGTYKLNTQADFAVCCLDAATGNERWRDTLSGGWQGTYWTAVDSTATFGVAGGQIANSGLKGFVRAYDLKTGARLLDDRVAGRVNTTTISGNGAWIACCYNGSGVRVYQRQTRSVLMRSPFANGSLRSPIVSSWPFHLKGPFFRFKTIVTYVKTAEFTNTQNIQTMSMSEDGHWIASAEYGGRVRIWERLPDGTIKVVNYQPPGSPTPQPYWEVPASDVGSGSSVSQVSAHFLDMSADGTWIAVAFSNGHVYLLKRDPFQEVFGHRTAGFAAYGARAYSAAGGAEAYVLASSSAYDPATKQYEVGQLELLHEGGGDHDKTIWSGVTAKPPNPGMAMDAQRKYVVVADGSPDLPDGSFYLFDTAVPTTPAWRHPVHQPSWPMTISVDGKTLVGGSDDGCIYCWKNDGP